MDNFRVLTQKDISNEMEYVSMHQFKITDLNKEKYILYTQGLFTCTGIIGINFKSKVGFLAHIAPSDNINRILISIKSSLESSYGKFDEKFFVYVCNGIQEGNVQKIILSNLELQTIFNPAVRNMTTEDGIGINCKTTVVFKYIRSK